MTKCVVRLCFLSRTLFIHSNNTTLKASQNKGVTMVKNPLLEIKAVAFMSKEQLLLLQLLITATMTVVSSAEQMEAPTETCALIKSLILNPSPSQIAFA